MMIERIAREGRGDVPALFERPARVKHLLRQSAAFENLAALDLLDALEVGEGSEQDVDRVVPELLHELRPRPAQRLQLLLGVVHHLAVAWVESRSTLE